jgi:hypothetical protein
VKGKILERLRDNSRWVPIGFRGLETQEVEFHGQRNSRNHRKRNIERWKFQNSRNHKGRGMIVSCSLKS